LRIERTTRTDLPVIRAAYAHGRTAQQELGANVWPEFSDEGILEEIDSGRLFRVSVDDATAGVFSLAFEDPAIWGSLEQGAHVYVHRIARAANWSGGGLMDGILAWVTDHCRSLGRVGVRIDTWASNAPLIAFYERRGFRLIGHRRIGVDPRLPPHYHENEFALLEYTCKPR
jgi:GNAT superfamily N-acetyltransferase